MAPHRSRSLLERVMLSASNYWFTLVADIAGAALFLAFGTGLYQGSWVASLVATAGGLLSWPAIEYAAHRWVLHGPPSAAQRAHAQHHRDGAALISAPALLSVAFALVLWGALSALMATGTAAFCVFGLYLGYNYYALLHHVQHHHPRLVALNPTLGRLERAHRIHHAKWVVNYGVTSTWLDRAFGSFRSVAPTEVGAAIPLPLSTRAGAGMRARPF